MPQGVHRFLAPSTMVGITGTDPGQRSALEIPPTSGRILLRWFSQTHQFVPGLRARVDRRSQRVETCSRSPPVSIFRPPIDKSRSVGGISTNLAACFSRQALGADNSAAECALWTFACVVLHPGRHVSRLPHHGLLFRLHDPAAWRC